ncbi:ABC transporter substrate-binding protein [Streptomyces brasiliscabiei]|uniref:ABC transporter substrate-binding protein n=1 Tax=Streptomyces brasiliscabiei TaxID=2736302 RepID=A0ABU8GIZ2_9ACTN
MSISRRNFVIASSVATAGGSLLLSACSSGGGGGAAGGGAASGSAATYSKVKVGTAADSTGPAPEITGARKGGTIHPIGPDDFSHLDPQRIYFAWNSTVANLYVRCLTGYRIAADGSMKLVGDLATDAGTMSDGGRTWTFTLKDGLKWEDGSELTVDDVRHGIERGFASFTTEGATYVQTWLTGSNDFRKLYKGPYGGKHLSSVVTDTAKRTVTFHLKTARPDLNWALAMHSYGAVPVKHDTKEKYDKDPVSCGPYRIRQHSVDKSLTLVRNTHWDPDTDPIRNAYPDSVVFEFGPESLQATDRLIADSGTDEYAVMAYSGVPAERIQKVISDSTLESRTIDGLLTGLYYYAINCRRIKDVRVRQALNYAWPLEQIRSIYGGPSAGDYATTILSPDIAGRVKFDAYGKLKDPRGDTAKAKSLLKEAGKLGQKIVYTYPQGANDAYDKTKVVIANALKEAGFDPVVKPVESTSYYDQVGQIDNQFDVMWYGWSPDWPAAYTLIQPLFDGTTIADNAPNVSQLNVSWVNAAIKKNTTITDTAKEEAAWAALDKEIMAKEAPIIPETYQRRYYLYGSKVGGAQFDPLFSAFIVYKLYAKA